MDKNKLIWSKYNHIFSTKDNEYLLYNSSTNGFIQIDRTLYKQLVNYKNGRSSIAEMDDDLIQDLVSQKILTTEEEQNDVFIAKRLRYNLNCYDRNMLSLTILPTMACNFKCSYCFEDANCATMTDDVIENLMSFIKSYVPQSKLGIAWFGGEPLVGFDKIKQILTRLKDENIELGGHEMVTNGYLLDEKVCEFFQQHPLQHIQITIDGKKETHDSRRIHKSGTGSYDTIIQNVGTAFEMLPTTKISIRVNVDSTNVGEFAEVYNAFREKWSNYTERLHIYPGFVTDFSSKSCGHNNCELNRQERAEFLKKLYIEYNIPIDFFPTHRFGSCVASNINAFVIGPRGEMYKCWCDVGVESKIVGYIDQQKLTNPSLFSNYMAGYTMFDDPVCKDCQLFPVCNGGCRWFRFERGDNRNYVCSLRKDNLDDILTLHYKSKKMQTEKQSTQ